MEKNQRTIKGQDGVERIYTFSQIKRKDAMKAQFLTGGFVRILGTAEPNAKGVIDPLSMDCSDENFEKYLWPLACIMLKGCMIHNDKEIVEVENLEDSDYFEGKFPDLMNAIFAACEVAGFLKPVASSTKATGKTSLKV